MAMSEWVLGNNPAKTAPFVLTSQDEESGALFATNPYSFDFAGRTSFFAVDAPVAGFTAKRREFIGRGGDIVLPGAVVAGQALSGSAEGIGDPCAALAVEIVLKPGEKRELLFVLGDTADADGARALAEKSRSADFDAVMATVRAYWSDFTGTLQVKTPDAALDRMVNDWLPYQALGCRIQARSAFYQASGAYGFRDQLQDTLAFVLHRPELARRQILNAAARQFVEGDVQHWWLPDSGAGVRTMISDDVVWLAHAVEYYCRTTGDLGILDETLAFIQGAPLAEGQHDAFYTPERSGEEASLYEHCARALDLALRRTGENGLPLILGGDWNDGMNRVGEAGRGTSVWLGWFLAGTLSGFIPVARERGDQPRADQWQEHLGRLKVVLETTGWDGGYYRRGYFDDGTPLGSAKAPNAGSIPSRRAGASCPVSVMWRVRGRRWMQSWPSWLTGRTESSAYLRRPSSRRRRIRATSRPIRRACGKMVGSIPMPRPGSCWRLPASAGRRMPGPASTSSTPSTTR